MPKRKHPPWPFEPFYQILDLNTHFVIYSTTDEEALDKRVKELSYRHHVIIEGYEPMYFVDEDFDVDGFRTIHHRARTPIA